MKIISGVLLLIFALLALNLAHNFLTKEAFVIPSVILSVIIMFAGVVLYEGVEELK